MSRKTETSTPKIDRRVRRTRDALGDALLTLMQEKPYGIRLGAPFFIDNKPDIRHSLTSA